MKQQHHAKAKMNNVCGPKMKQQHHGKAKMNKAKCHPNMQAKAKITTPNIDKMQPNIDKITTPNMHGKAKMKQQHGPNMHAKAKLDHGLGGYNICTQEIYPP